MQKSDFLRFKKSDWVKGLITAVIMGIISTVFKVDIVDEEFTNIAFNGIPTKAELMSGLRVGVFAGFAYIVKNFLTNSNDKFLKKEVKDPKADFYK